MSPRRVLGTEADQVLVSRRLVVRAKDVVFVKGVVEAHEGLAHVSAERGGDLTIVAPRGRAAELAELVTDLARELDGIAGEEQELSGAASPDPDRGR